MIFSKAKLAVNTNSSAQYYSWEWKFPLTVWFVSGLFLQGWGILLQILGIVHVENFMDLYFGAEPIGEAWLSIWQRWDAIHYAKIVSDGYIVERLSAFFPLYPLLGRFVSFITHTNDLFALLLVSNLAFAGSLIILYRLTSEMLNEELARYAIIYIVLFPHAYFFRAPYTESLALLLVLATFYAAGKGQWVLAAILGLMAGLTRGTVFPIGLALVGVVWKEQKLFPITWKSLHYLIAFMPMLGNALFVLWRYYQGFPSLILLQEQIWSREVVFPWEPFTQIIRLMRSGELFPGTWFSVVILLMIIAVSFWGWKILPVSLRIYQVLLVLFLLMNMVPSIPLVDAFGRYALLLFPTYILLSAWASTPFRRLSLFGFLITFQLFLSAGFFMWAWTG